ncbi:MAG: UDP-N-acetylmuramate--L-alanine ligase [Bacteroidota bacterium]
MNPLTQRFQQVYFLGIGGIGMSALARYFRAAGLAVAGYDRTSTPLTDSLIEEGMEIHFQDSVEAIPSRYRDPLCVQHTLIIRTPAVPSGHSELNWFVNAGYTLMKRSEVLGLITQGQKTLAVAGTHGKTTTSSILAHLLQRAGHNCTAFLGGISTNFGSNLLLGDPAGQNHEIVVEADEFDRSFLTLHPYGSVITSMDPDHLDIYGSESIMHDTYRSYASQVSADGVLVVKEGLHLGETAARQLSYGVDSHDTDYSARRIFIHDGNYCFDLHTPGFVLEGLKLGLPGRHNVENAVGACALALESGTDPGAIPSALATYSGVQRRFERHISSGSTIYIDDYAHHPSEIRAAIGSARELFPERRLTVVFQPHLFSRTRDFMQEFADALSLADNLYLLEIYPARELPIAGITSSALLDCIGIQHKQLIGRSELLDRFRSEPPALLLTLGAGDIDQLVQPLKTILRHD